MRFLLRGVIAALVSSLPLSAAQVALTWTDNSTNETGFNIERAVGTGAFVKVGSVGANQTSYVDQRLNDSTDYRYRVQAYNAAGASAFTNVISLKTVANVAPTIGAIAQQSFASTTPKAITFTVSDANIPASELSVMAASSNPVIIPSGNIKISGSGSSRTVTLTPIAGVKGTASITIAVHDGERVSYRSFPVVVSGTKVPVAPASVSHAQRIVAANVLAVSGTDFASVMTYTTVGGSKAVLVRGVGPGLTALGVPKVLADPRLMLVAAGTSPSENENWTASSALSSLFTRVGAFPIPAGSRDAVISTTALAGMHAALLGTAVPSSSGVGLLELYDADTATIPTGRVKNVIMRARAGGTVGTLTAGFTLKGTQPVPILVRGFGRGLSTAVKRHRLEIFRGTQRLQLVEAWQPTGPLLEATLRAGVQPSQYVDDTATLLTLAPGAYTITLTVTEGTAGPAAVEIYDVR